MMKAITKLIFGIMGMLLGGSCLPDPLPVNDIPVLEAKIVVSSQIIPDQGLVVLLTRSIGALDAGKNTAPENLLNQLVISNALVTLQHNDDIDTLQYLGSGLYGGLTLNFIPGESYVLKAKSDSLGEVSAVSQVKQQVLFQSVNASVVSNDYDSLAVVDYSLNDPAGKNFYMINFQGFSATQTLTSFVNPRVFTRLVTDAAFDGEYFQEEFKVFFQDYSVGDTVAVFLSNINEEYYQFLKLRNDNRYGIADFASEPLNYPSNVKGGYGFFNLHIPDARVFVLK